jgi:hypothetical protein
MKSKKSVALFFITLIFYWVGLCNASAFYDPGAQRWLNRDPIDNEGFQTLKDSNSNLLNDDAHNNVNLFGYINNNGIDNSDDFGLLCVKSSITLID